MLDWIKTLLRDKERVTMPDALRLDVKRAAETFFRMTFPDRLSEVFQLRASTTVWADEETRFIVAVTTGNPGAMYFLAVAKTTLATSVVEEELRYRPRGLK